MRYRTDDGFGQPTVAFIICTFWLVEALATLGRAGEARELLERAKSALSPLGLLSEDYDAEGTAMWGNFPTGLFARRAHPRRVRRLSPLGDVL